MGFDARLPKITCCKDCPDRYQACWGSCERYKEQRAKYDAQKEEIRKKKIIASNLAGQRYDCLHKVTKYQKYRAKYRKGH